jgi:nicotinate-nucleotide--dimethylbenzimidazole phosphoribosyltransferase
VRPGLERAGWAQRRPLADVVHSERWPAGDEPPTAAPIPDAAARIAARDRADRLVKPAGSLGALEDVVERWSAATGAPPPAPLRAAHLLLAADHGHAARGTSLFDGAVSGQVAAAAARGETAIGVLARARGETLVVADVGLRGPTPAGCIDRRCAAGTADFVDGPAMTAAQRDAALAAGAALARALLEESAADCLVLGEIGIGNTATAAALLCALTGSQPDEVVGRGTGLDAQGVERKTQTVAAALARVMSDGDGDLRAPAEALRELGGLELAALVGAIHAAHHARTPVVLDGLAVGVAALAAVRLRPTCREWLLAGHRSAEPAHGLVLDELGLEPLLDLRLRLGEASGAALALPLIEQAGRLHREMATFAEAGVDGP